MPVPVLAAAVLCHHEGMSDQSSAAATIAALRLEPHREGGYFRETYRASSRVDTPQGVRAAATSIDFLLTVAQPSRFHRLLSAELWVYRAGAPLELWLLGPDGGVRRLLLGPGGPGERAAERLTARVAPHVWQGARVVVPAAEPHGPGDEVGAPCDWSLVSCIVTPGFEYSDFELGRRDLLRVGWPEASAAIDVL